MYLIATIIGIAVVLTMVWGLCRIASFFDARREEDAVLEALWQEEEEDITEGAVDDGWCELVRWKDDLQAREKELVE